MICVLAVGCAHTSRLAQRAVGHRVAIHDEVVDARRSSARTSRPMEVLERIAKPPSSSSSMASVWAVAERRFATTMPDVAKEQRLLK